MFRNTLLLLITAAIAGCGEPPSALSMIRAGGVLRVALIPNEAGFYGTESGPSGAAFDLASAFAGWLELPLEVVAADDAAAALRLLHNRRVHFSASLLPPDPELLAQQDLGVPSIEQLAFGPSLFIDACVRVEVRSTDTVPPAVEAQQNLSRLAADIGCTESRAEADHNSQSKKVNIAPARKLLKQLGSAEVRSVVMREIEFDALRAEFPRTYIAEQLGPPLPLTWTFLASADQSLKQAVAEFIRQSRGEQSLAELSERYFPSGDDFDFVAARSLIRHYHARLPSYRAAFEKAATDHSFDWLLLAAMSYQESHWNNNARSPTGVRGLMMLTRQTAAALGVDRLDPDEAIDGGARYLRRLESRLPDSIEPADRIWFALAAYNLGLAHLEDARVLSERAGLDPNRWDDVRHVLPRLAQKKWYETVKHGRGRGYQARHFVDNIRRYYRALKRLERQPQLELPAAVRTEPWISPVF